MFKKISTPIPDLVEIQTSPHIDDRGLFFEIFRKSEFLSLNLPTFVQDNISTSNYGIIRGLHFQKEPYSQGKLVLVISGKIYDVVVDIRADSNTFGETYCKVLDFKTLSMLYIPPGFAHGFCTLSDQAIVFYKTTCEYSKEHEGGIRWDDPELDIDWPIKNPIISDKDKNLSSFCKLQGEDFG